MTNTWLIQVIKAEIERRLKDYWKICFHDVKAYNEDSNVRELKELLSLLSDLEKSLPAKAADSESFEKEFSKFSNDPDAEDYAFPIDLADFKDFARHFYDLGCRRTAEKYDEIEYEKQRAEESEKSMNQDV